MKQSRLNALGVLAAVLLLSVESASAVSSTPPCAPGDDACLTEYLEDLYASEIWDFTDTGVVYQSGTVDSYSQFRSLDRPWDPGFANKRISNYIKDGAPGFLTSYDSDFIFVGAEPISGNRNDLVIEWGDDTQAEPANTQDPLKFVHKSFYGGRNERMRIAPNGNVGIGEEAPVSKLHVAGDIRLGKVQDIDNGQVSSGPYLHFSGGGDWENWDSDNSDHLNIHRHNAANDRTELRVQIGDNYQGHVGDKFVVGSKDYTNPGSWNEWFAVNALGDAQLDDSLSLGGQVVFGVGEDADGAVKYDAGDLLGKVDGQWKSLTAGNDDEDLWEKVNDDAVYMSGHVGIGTNSPSVALEVVTSGGKGALDDAARIRVRSTGDKERAPGIEFVNNDVSLNNAARIVTRDWAALSFEYGKESRDQIKDLMTLRKDGKLILGERNSDARLGVVQSVTSGGSPLGKDMWFKLEGRAQDPNNDLDAGQFWVEYGAQSAPNVVISDKDDASRITFQKTGNGTDTAPQHSTWIGMEAGGNAHMKIASPKLTVDGDVFADAIAINEADPKALFHLDGNDPRIGNIYMGSIPAGVSAVGDFIYDGGNDSTFFFDNVGDANGWTAFSHKGSKKLVVENGGDVGIGVNNPDVKLDVAGTIQSNNVNVCLQDGTDCPTFPAGPQGPQGPAGPGISLTNSPAACNGTTEGTLYYDTDENAFFGCDGDEWQELSFKSAKSGKSGKSGKSNK